MSSHKRFKLGRYLSKASVCLLLFSPLAFLSLGMLSAALRRRFTSWLSRALSSLLWLPLAVLSLWGLLQGEGPGLSWLAAAASGLLFAIAVGWRALNDFSAPLLKPLIAVAMALALPLAYLEIHAVKSSWIAVGSQETSKVTLISALSPRRSQMVVGQDSATWDDSRVRWNVAGSAESIALTFKVEARRVQANEAGPQSGSPGAVPDDTSFTLSVYYDGRSVVEAVALTNAWQVIEVPLVIGPSLVSKYVSAHLKVAPGEAIEIRSAQLLAPGNKTVRLEPESGAPRARLTSNHPNVAGHAISILASVFALGAKQLVLRATGLALATGLVVATGSRSSLALMAFLVLIYLVPLVRRFVAARGPRLGLLSLLIVTGAAVFTWTEYVGPAALFERPGSGGPARVDIWQAALDALSAHPLTGLIGANLGFAEFWAQGYAREFNGVMVSHAHNIVLDFASSFGIVGLLAIVAHLLLMVRWSRRASGWRGVMVSVSVLALNLFDATLTLPFVACAWAATVCMVSPDPKGEGVGRLASLMSEDRRSTQVGSGWAVSAPDSESRKLTAASLMFSSSTRSKGPHP